MKDGDQSLLQNRAQVDQQIPATDQVDAGERRVLHRVLLRKEADLVDGLRDLIASAIEFDEEVFQPLGRNICGSRLWKHAGASNRNPVTGHVSAKDLDRNRPQNLKRRIACFLRKIL